MPEPPRCSHVAARPVNRERCNPTSRRGPKDGRDDPWPWARSRREGRRHRPVLAPKRDPGDNPSVAQPTLESQSTPVTDVRWLPAPTPTIPPATDLGGVAVLKHGNLYL